MAKSKDGAEEKRGLPPGSVFINIEQPGQVHISSINFEEQMRKLDASQCSERIARMKWTVQELPRRAAKSTSVGQPLGPWIIPYNQAQDCYIYGFYRAAIAMSGSIAESMCLTLLHKIVGHGRKYENMTLGQLIKEIRKDVSLSEQKNICRLRKINEIRNKWLHMKSNDFFIDMMEVLEQEESVTKADAERILVLVHETLGSIFEIRSAGSGRVQIHMNAQGKQDSLPESAGNGI